MNSAQHEVDLTPFNTLALPSRAARYLKITDPAQLTAGAGRGEARFILGGGSNLVLTGKVDRLVLHMAIPGRRLLAEDAAAWYVEAAAGENWHDFVQWTLAQGWPGLENLSLIPGTVGAAPIQNIGAYGLEVGECFQEARCWDFAKQSFFTVDRDFCRFSYRDSRFKQEGWHLDGQIAIVSVVFRLPKRWQANLRYAELPRWLLQHGISEPLPSDIAQAVMAIRRQKLPDPQQLPNAGSFFHNPRVSAATASALHAQFPQLPAYPQTDGQVKLAAGWLIEQAGWKGRRIGPVGMYERQALVLVNHGGATSEDIQRTLSAVQCDVHAQFGILLHPEPVFL